MPLIGSFTPPGDKSVSHRVALMSLLATGRCRVLGYAPGQDCASSLGAVRALGGLVEQSGRELVLSGAGAMLTEEADIDCGNSGTTMRLLMGILSGAQGSYRLHGDESLSRRPMERVAGPLRQMGAAVQCTDGHAPVTIQAKSLCGQRHELEVASAQLKTALLLAGLAATGATEVIEPHPSRDHTERLLASWGADFTQDGHVLRVRPSGLILPSEVQVPGDPSSAAFFLCAAAILPGSQVTARRMMLGPTRTGFLEVLQRMGAELSIETHGSQPEPWGSVRVAFGPELRGCEVSQDEIPALLDEVPILALVASQAQGETILHGAGELRHKECDRLEASVTELGRLGADLREDGDALVITGPTPLRPAADLDSRGDHRMAMTLRLACLLAGGNANIAGEECCAVSWPGFSGALRELSQ